MLDQILKQWSDDQKKAVWRKGRASGEYDPSVWRIDSYGSWMRYSDYGNRDSKYGWEIDHIVPQSKGGTDDLSNLQPLQWENNVRKGDK